MSTSQQPITSDPADAPVFVLKELLARFQREQNKIQDLLSSLGFALRSFNNLNQFLEIIPMMAARVTDATGSLIILYKPSGQVRLEQIHCLDGQNCQDIRLVIETSIQQFNSRQYGDQKLAHALIGEVLDQQLAESLSPQIRLLSTSILVKSSEMGRLYVFSDDPAYIWSGMRQKLLRLVADQTAVAIATNDLTSELRKKERLDRELEIGAYIQRQLLPSKCPEIWGLEMAARCETASQVGGDYYDFIPAHYDQLESSAQGKWSMVIGDVMGKGVPAGLIMTMTRGMLRAEVLNGHSPARILAHLNRVMYADLENSRRFVTLFYSEYNPLNQSLAYSNAAHNPPLLWRARDNTIVQLDNQPGTLIGLEANAVYTDTQVQLYPGDTLLYYTDGLTDAANSQGDRFEVEQLSEKFHQLCHASYSPQEIVDALFAEVQDFSQGNSGKNDDMTLIVMRLRRSGLTPK